MESPRKTLSSDSTPPQSPRPAPMTTFDRIFILFASATVSMLTYKSMRPGFFQKGLSFSILAGGAAYALGINRKCCEKTFKEIFSGFDGCSTMGGAGHRWGFGIGHPSDRNDSEYDRRSGLEERRDDKQRQSSPPRSHGTGETGTFEERD